MWKFLQIFIVIFSKCNVFVNFAIKYRWNVKSNKINDIFSNSNFEWRTQLRIADMNASRIVFSWKLRGWNNAWNKISSSHLNLYAWVILNRVFVQFCAKSNVNHDFVIKTSRFLFVQINIECFYNQKKK